MQRVAEELLAELQRRSDIELRPMVLRGTWRWIHVRTVSFLFQTFFRLLRLVGSGRIDAVLFSSMVTATLTIPLRRKLASSGTKSLVIVHGLDVTTPFPPYQWLVRRVYRSVDLVLPVSRATARACIQRGMDENRVRVVNNGVDRRRFPTGRVDDAAQRHEILQSIETPTLPDDALLLCSVGRLVRRKGYAWFIDHVMPRLPAHVHYWIAGDGPEARTVQSAIDRNGMSGRVRMLGKVTEGQLQALYRGADLFVMPNVPIKGDMEGFGIVMLEAGMNGLPTLAARIEGITEVIREGENGLFVESGDAEGFERMITALDADRRRLRALGSRARSYTEATFGWETIADQYLEACGR